MENFATSNQIVIQAIMNTKAMKPEFWQKILEKRVEPHLLGSAYEYINSPQKLEEKLLSCNWIETTHPEINPKKFRVFKTKLPGKFNLAKISEMPNSSIFETVDLRGNGRITLIIPGGINKKTVDETFLIIGTEFEQDIVINFHPGEPIKPTEVYIAKMPQGVRIHKETAIKHNFIWAKIV